MLHRRIRRHAVTEVEDERAVRQRLDDRIDSLVQSSAAGNQPHRIEIALHALARFLDALRLAEWNRPVEPDGIDATLRREPVVERTGTLGKADHRRIGMRGLHLRGDCPDWLQAPCLERGLVKHARPGIEDLHRLAKEIGVDAVKLKTAQVYNYKHGNPLIPTRERFARYRQLPDGSWAPRNSLNNHCWKLWHACVVTWDGLVVPCCFDKDATHRMGDLKTAPFREIWQDSAYRNFRLQILKGRSAIDICTNCTEGCKVWA